MLAFGMGDKSIRLWDLDAHREKAKLDGHRWVVRDLAFTPDGSSLASSCGDFWANLTSEAILWDVANGKARSTLRGHGGPITTLALSRDGKHLATGSADFTARLWNVADGRLLAVLPGHSNRVLSVSFNHDGSRLLTASADTTLKLWDTTTLQEVATLRPNIDVQGAAFSPDGRTVAAVSGLETGTGEIVFWRAATPDDVARRASSEGK
jgi:WD40 repeat protein